MKIELRHFFVVVFVVVGFFASCVLFTGCAVRGASTRLTAEFGVQNAETVLASAKRETKVDTNGSKSTKTTLGGIPANDQYRPSGNVERDPLR